MIPLLHDFSSETVLVFGGGSVGARKARRFAREAAVVVVSPTFTDDDFDEGSGDAADDRSGGASGDAADDESGGASGDAADDDPFGGAERVRAAPRPGDVADWIDRVDPALAVAATDDESVNGAVADAARDRGILVNRADRSGERAAGSVVVPATIREDPVVIALSTSGTAPALSKHLRRELEAEVDGAGEMARALERIRRELEASGVPAARRREVVTDVVSTSDHWTALRTGAANHRQVIEDVLGSHLSPDAESEPDAGGDSP